MPLLMAMLLVVTGCFQLPITEMVDARDAISRAESVKAEKYAPELLKEAKDALFVTHKNVSDEKANDAKENAELSYAKAMEAYNKAIPLLTRETIESAEENMDLAEKAYAEKLAARDYTLAGDLLEQAKKEEEEKKFEQSLEHAREADRLARSAYNISMGQKVVLKDSIADVKQTLEKARSIGADKESPEKLELADTYVAEAEKAYEEDRLKDGFTAIETAKVNADEAFMTSMKKRSQEYLDKSEEVLARAEKSPVAKKSPDEMAAAREAREQAKLLHWESRYDESIEYSEQSIRHARTAMNEPTTGGESILISREGGKDGAKEGDVTGKPSEGTAIVKEDENYWYYRVQKREPYTDCLWRIAGRFYQKPYLWRTIYKANEKKIKNPDIIYPGQILRVPKK
jgi:nucleoid-associated protein YgaU